MQKSSHLEISIHPYQTGIGAMSEYVESGRVKINRNYTSVKLEIKLRTNEFSWNNYIRMRLLINL